MSDYAMQMQSEQISEFAAALAMAQAEIVPADKDRENPFFKSSYATLASVWDVIRAPLSKNGLSVVQIPTQDGEKLVLFTTVLHKSGQWVRSRYPIQPVKSDPQGIGSAITYARRYALSAMVGVVADEDDDGEGASGRDTKPQRLEPKRPPPPAAKASNGNGHAPAAEPATSSPVPAVAPPIRQPENEAQREKIRVLVAAFEVCEKEEQRKGLVASLKTEPAAVKDGCREANKAAQIRIANAAKKHDAEPETMRADDEAQPEGVDL